MAGLPRWQKIAWSVGFLFFVGGVSTFVFYVVKFSALIDARLSGQVFNNASLVFGAPTPLRVGDPATPGEIALRLRKALYSTGESSRVGGYRISGSRLEIYPGPLSFSRSNLGQEGAAAIEFRGGRVASISDLSQPSQPESLQSYLLEPELVTTLFDQNRTKRRLVGYEDLPKVLVNAVLAAEDRRFFSHHGVNVYRIIDAVFRDLRADERLQGGSTLTMQVARNFFLTPQRTVRRKLAEISLALLMEQRLSKEQIFELYANEVYLGQRGSFSIDGFGEAADAYFNKDVKSLTLPEGALLAALIRGPNLYNPYRHPGQALKLRNYVLREMQGDGFITVDEEKQAENAPLGVAPQNVEGSQAPFFVDMVKDQLLAQFSEQDLLSQSYRIYTTLDPELQRAASEGVRSGMAEVDEELAKRKRRRNEAQPEPNQPQVALVALDPHTGELRALVGGRNYAVSQLNHALARRQPGSSFKPFVYAAALSSAVDGSEPVITPATQLMDLPTAFEYEGRTYEPRNYKAEYHGPVTLREALMYSLNSATVSLAQMVGYNKVRQLAVEAGINRDLLATPAIALGAYVATPLEIANAYTIFANGGEYLSPKFIVGVNDASGRTLWKTDQTRRQVLDPRVSYLMVNLMQSVIDHGTAAGVRSRGFYLPAAGKTGTSHDGWFAGFTSNLLAIVWVGYDDDRELNLSGASSALPVWTGFMKAAAGLSVYRNAKPFVPPAGVVTAKIDLPGNPNVAGDPAGSREEVFVAGTEPHNGPALLEGARSVLSRILHLGIAPASASSSRAQSPPGAASQAGESASQAATGQAQAAEMQPQAAKAKKKEGVVKKLFSIFKHGRAKEPTPEPPPAPPDD